MVTEVFNRIGEAEIHSEIENKFQRWKKENQKFETSEETTPKNISKERKEFIESLKEDSLTLDDCTRITHNWKKE